MFPWTSLYMDSVPTVSMFVAAPFTTIKLTDIIVAVSVHFLIPCITFFSHFGHKYHQKRAVDTPIHEKWTQYSLPTPAPKPEAAACSGTLKLRQWQHQPSILQNAHYFIENLCNHFLFALLFFFKGMSTWAYFQGLLCLFSTLNSWENTILCPH